MTEDHTTRLRRLRMRSIRRGIKEMDLILGAYSENGLVDLSVAELDIYEEFLAENDQDLFSWVSGQSEAPAIYAQLVDNLRAQSAVGQGSFST